MDCILYYQELVIGINSRIQAKKGLISYYKTNGITSLKKHVDAEHSVIIKMFEENVIATLALGSQSRQKLTKVWAKSEPGSHILCSQECKRMQGNEPSHFQMSSHFGSWSPNGLPNLQKAITRVKPH
jgi:hypothetical protein